VNAQLKSDRDVDFEAIRLDSVVDAIADAPGLKIVLVDACRNNPFLVEMERTSATRSIGRGLARVDPSGVLVGYSARGGTLALDGRGRNSPYAQAILRHIEEPGLEIGKLFRKVRDTVFEMTDGAQEPFTYGSLPGEDIYLVAAPPLQPDAGERAISTTEAGIIEDFAAAEAKPSLAAWSALVEKYAAYPDNSLVRLAAQRRDALQAAEDARELAASRKPWLDVAFDWKGQPEELTREDRMLIQRSLGYMGFDVGAVDGEFGPKTLRAISAARFRSGLPAGAKVDAAFLKAIPDPRAMDALRSPTARYYSVEELPEGIDPRLRNAIESLGRVKIKFDYFEGRIYLAVHQLFGRWDEASVAARKAGGHLVTLSSAAENRFVYDLFSSDPVFTKTGENGSLEGPLIGLFQATGSSEPGGGWTWETGEPLDYTNWSPGNPDNYAGRQSHARFFRPAEMRGTSMPAIYWDDTHENLWYLGYIMEIE
jgi:hypothetical protein